MHRLVLATAIFTVAATLGAALGVVTRHAEAASPTDDGVLIATLSVVRAPGALYRVHARVLDSTDPAFRPGDDITALARSALPERKATRVRLSVDATRRLRVAALPPRCRHTHCEVYL